MTAAPPASPDRCCARNARRPCRTAAEPAGTPAAPNLLGTATGGHMFFGRKPVMVTRQDALPGRPDRPFRIAPDHVVLGTPIEAPAAPGHEEIFFGMGCFWGSERIFWQIPGVDVTAVGYQGGYTPNPTYEETTTGLTGHAEVVRVVYDPSKADARDPAQGVLGEPRPDDAEPAGQRRRHDVPLGDLHRPATRSRRLPRSHGPATSRRSRRPGSARSRPRSSRRPRPARSGTPRTTTRATCTRTRAATATTGSARWRTTPRPTVRTPPPRSSSPRPEASLPCTHGDDGTRCVDPLVAMPELPG